ncbi:cation:proton antiporter domain-containing protein [Marinoscillum pacificum]|uniref:cation:proton antiporter domain-containing protein n=1 Tax=Marinoscillum pacificum TaxID=392723 RepID=UPI0021587EAD|nr:cation:proton antiporter [Marinoscillum pacificum]
MLTFLSTYKELILVLSGFLIIALASNQIAKSFQKIRLPLITGLIFTGIISGPHIIGLIPISAKDNLQFINEIALAFIAFAAGAELYLKELRSRFKSIKWNTFGQLVVTFVVGSIAVYFCADYIPYMREMSTAAKISVSTITAAIFVARSPASAIAVINELRAKGPFVQTVMGVTVVKDFLVIILFSICLAVGESLIAGEDFKLLSIVHIIVELALSFGIGFYAFGQLLKFVLSLKIIRPGKTVLVLLVGFSSYLLSHAVKDLTLEYFNHGIHMEPLLMSILASFFVTNYTKYRAEFINILEHTATPIYIAFFTYTGATLAINVIGSVIGVALILFAIRIITMIMGAYTGGILAGDPMKQNHLGWMPYVTQAGVGLGLATVIADTFPGWGDEFATVIIAVIVINQFLGPPLFKWAIYQLGEDRTKAQTPEFDGIRDAIIFGFESQSVALANQLRENGWEVQIATKLQQGSIDEPEGISITYGIKDFSKEEFDLMNADKTEAIVTMLSDEENLKICDTAYHHFGTRDVIVRLNHRYNYDKFLALDAKVVDPSTAMVSLLDHFVRSPQATSLLLGMEKGQDSRDVEILNPDIHGLTLRDLRLPGDVIILSIMRGGQSIITHGYTRLRLRDIVTVVGSIKSLEEVQFKFDN